MRLGGRGAGAIGKDVAAIRALLEPEGAGAKPDFAAAGKIWSAGKSSAKSDSTFRTLAGFVEQHPAGTGVADALAGSGTAASLSDGERVEWIDKGVVVALKVHALEEFDGAKEKLKAGDLDPKEGRRCHARRRGDEARLRRPAARVPRELRPGAAGWMSA